jgi:hypothetical protein
VPVAVGLSVGVDDRIKTEVALGSGIEMGMSVEAAVGGKI